MKIHYGVPSGSDSPFIGFHFCGKQGLWAQVLNICSSFLRVAEDVLLDYITFYDIGRISFLWRMVSGGLHVFFFFTWKGLLEGLAKTFLLKIQLKIATEVTSAQQLLAPVTYCISFLIRVSPEFILCLLPEVIFTIHDALNSHLGSATF